MQNDEYINYYNEKNYVEIFTDDNYIEVSNTGGLTGKTGERGADGRDGQDGQNATIRVGQTITAEPGTPAQVENTGTDTNAILKFTIPKGSKGDRGEKGYQGDAATVSVGSTTTGAPGTSAVVTNTGDEHQAVLNFTIPRGAQGAQGQDGESSTITVGTTTTGNPGTNASVTNTGTESAAVLNFTIPRGNPGEKGDDGDSATIEVGTTTTGEPGTNASVVNTGTQSAAVLNFTIPRGNKGDSGDPGEDGQAATIAVGTVTTGEPGTPATVTNVGTSSAAIFNFSIPKGAKGESGEGTGDMLASTYDPNQTVANNGGIVQYIDNQGFIDDSYHDATKQDKLSATQLSATNSGITSAKVSTYDGYASTIAGKQDTISDLATIRSGAQAGATALQSESDPVFAASPAHGITSANITSWNGKQNALSTAQLNAVNSGITSGKVSTYDGYATSKQNKLTAGTGISIVGDTISNTQTSAEWGAITGTLSSQTDLQTALNAKANTSSLATVATTGAYLDLSGLPTIPTVNNATLTIQKNGADVQTFTANSSTNKTANIVVPTATSDLTNDSGFQNATQVSSSISSAISGILPITTANISDRAVTQAKIDWTQEPCTSTFTFTGTATQDTTITTKRGTVLNVRIANTGTLVCVTGGATNIKSMRVRACYGFTANVTNAPRFWGLAPNSTIYTFETGLIGGTAVNKRESFTSVSGSIAGYESAQIVTESGNKRGTAYEVTYVRDSANKWRAFGNIMHENVSTAYQFISQMDASNAGTIPCIYQAGTISLGNTHYLIMEILED